MANQPPSILVEKHWIPYELYMRLYHGNDRRQPQYTATTYPEQPLYDPPSYSHNYYPERHQARNVTTPRTSLYSTVAATASNNPPTTQPAATRNVNINSTGNGSGGNTPRPAPTASGTTATSSSTLNANDLLTLFNTQPRSGNSIYTRFMESTIGPDGVPVITHDSEATTTGSTGMGILGTLMRTLLNTNVIPEATSGLSETEISDNSTLIEYYDEMDVNCASCSICTNEWQDGEQMRKLSACRHYFHRDCIDTWLTTNRTCPLCRTPIASIDSID